MIEFAPVNALCVPVHVITVVFSPNPTKICNTYYQPGDVTE